MLYLSKYKDTLVKKIFHGTKAPLQSCSGDGLTAYSKMGFSVLDCQAQEKIEEISGIVPKAVFRERNAFFYVVGSRSPAISNPEISFMQRAKAKVASTLASGNDDILLSLMPNAVAIASSELLKCTDVQRAQYLSYFVAHDTVGYGPLSILLEDKHNLEEIEVNALSAQIAVYHIRYGRCLTNLRFNSEQAFKHDINRFIYDAEKEIGPDAPVIDTQVGNARVHAQIAPYALGGASASIRLQGNKSASLDYLVKKGTLSCDALAYLWMSLDAGLNIVIAGSPASGKTTVLSALMQLIPKYQKIVTIEEEVNELKIDIDVNNTVALYGTKSREKIGVREQVQNALRMRPQRVIVGEVRGDETRELFSASNLGVQFMTTMHSNEGGADTIKRLLLSPMSVEPSAIGFLDIVVYMQQTDITKRVVSHVYEYKWLSRAETLNGTLEVGNGDSVEICESVSNAELIKAYLMYSKVADAFSKKYEISKKLAVKELERRSAFIKKLCDECKTQHDAIARINDYSFGF